MLLGLGISHKTAPIEVREKLAFSPEVVPFALKRLMDELGFDEAALLSTCNRTEFYCRTSVFEQNEHKLDQLLSWWHQFHAPAFEIQAYAYSLSNEGLVKHLMRVACGLDSMVLGETQILGQMKRAYHTATQTGAVGMHLSRLFQTSFSVAKKIRHTTGISANPVSLAFSAIILAKQIFSDLSQTNVLLIGAGENIELVLRYLLTKQVRNIFIVNRTFSRATELARRYGVKALQFQEIPAALTKADIVITSIYTQQPILTQACIKKACKGAKRRPILMVDLGVPRNIDTQVSQDEDVYLYTIDDLEGIIHHNMRHRYKAAQEAERIVARSVHLYMDWMTSQGALSVVREVRLRAEAIKQKALKDAIRLLEKGRDPKEVMQYLSHWITQKIMHTPTRSIRQMSLEKSHEKLDTVKELFNVD